MNVDYDLFEGAELEGSVAPHALPRHARLRPRRDQDGRARALRAALARREAARLVTAMDADIVLADLRELARLDRRAGRRAARVLDRRG